MGLAAMLTFSDFASEIIRIVPEYPRTCALSALIIDYKG